MTAPLAPQWWRPGFRYCHDCEVGWEGNDETCWSCGAPGDLAHVHFPEIICTGGFCGVFVTKGCQS